MENSLVTAAIINNNCSCIYSKRASLKIGVANSSKYQQDNTHTRLCVQNVQLEK